MPLGRSHRGGSQEEEGGCNKDGERPNEDLHPYRAGTESLGQDHSCVGVMAQRPRLTQAPAWWLRWQLSVNLIKMLAVAVGFAY